MQAPHPKIFPVPKNILKALPLLPLITDEEISDIVALSFLADKSPCDFIDAFCDAHGYYSEQRQKVSSVCWDAYLNYFHRANLR